MHGFELLLRMLSDLVVPLVALAAPIATWFLGLVFGVGGAAKVRSPILAATAMVDFGVTRKIRPDAGLWLGFAEIGLGFALISGLWPILSASVAFSLLCVFAFLIARSLSRGESFACHCFGDSDGPLTRWTFIRTAGLGALAIVLALAGDAYGPPDAAAGVLAATALAVVVLSRYALQLWPRSVGGGEWMR